MPFSQTQYLLIFFGCLSQAESLVSRGPMPLVRFSLSRELLGILGGRVELGGGNDALVRLILPLRQSAQPVLTGAETPS